jgi:hypothetical protein
MTTITTTAPVRRGPVGQTARWFLTAQVRLARWLWAIGVVLTAIGVSIYAATADTVSTSVAQYGLQPLAWLPLSIFIGQALGYMPAHVASGLTRRALSRGALTAAVATALGYGAAFAVLMWAERAAYGAFGWAWSVGSEGATTAAFLVASTATFVLANVAGLLVGIVYLRHGGWWGTLTLPLTVGPVVVLLVLVPISDTRQLFLAAGVAVLLAAVVALLYDRQVRGAAVPPKR